MQLFAPGQRLRHAVHAAGNHTELGRLVLRQRFDELALGDALQRLRNARKRSCQPAPVVPKAQAQHREHRDKEHARGERRLHGVVAGVYRDLRGGGRLSVHDGRGVMLLQAIEALVQRHHRGLSGARVPPDRDLCDQADERHGDERRRKESSDARRTPTSPHGAP